MMLRFPDVLLGWLDDRIDTWKRKGWGDIPAAGVLLSPALVILLSFVILPMVSSFYLSLFGGRHGLGPFVGLNNYKEAFFSEDFRQSFLVTCYYVMGVVPTTVLLSFFIALALNQISVLKGLLRSMYFLPYVTSAVAAAMVWRSLFNPQTGVINLLLSRVGIEPLQWLLEPRGVLHLLSGGIVPESWGPSLALCCIILFDIWHSCGFMIVVFLAGLTTIPKELEEAARIDGATGLRHLCHVTIPLLSPTIFFLVIVGIIKSFQSFNSFYALTHGGGMASTQNLLLYTYVQFYQYGYWGYGSAVAVLLMGIIVSLTLVQWKLLGRLVFYS